LVYRYFLNFQASARELLKQRRCLRWHRHSLCAVLLSEIVPAQKNAGYAEAHHVPSLKFIGRYGIVNDTLMTALDLGCE
jgi:hypothetical protein